MDAFELLILVYHSINKFMATDSGELFKKFVELFLFTVVSYMILSEYGRSKERHLKYLFIGFAALVVDKFIMSLFFAAVVFGDVQLLILNPFLPVLDELLELFALILLTNSFIFPVFADKVDKLKKKMSFEVVVLFIFVFVIEIFWLFTVIKVPAANFQDHLGFLLLELLKILVLYSPIYYIIANMNKFGRYGPHIIIAFLVYMITPITNVINFVFFDCSNNNLVVFAHPFLFISILLFTRVTFLKLVDKATLKRELAETKQKYVHEHELSIMKDEFVSTVSHELRTPITSMKLYLSLLRQKKFGVLNNKQLKAVKIVENESNRLSKLISDILNLSRLESKKVAVKIDEVNLRRLINDNLYYNLAEQKGLIIENKILKKFLVKIDSEKFKQVFINLFSNAVSYAKSKIIIFASKKTNYWEFIIEDDGVGIPKDKIDKLFDKFYRIGDYLTKDKGGTGLGLAIVKNIVKMHRGEIIVESEEGKGSRFIVRIPYL